MNPMDPTAGSPLRAASRATAVARCLVAGCLVGTALLLGSAAASPVAAAGLHEEAILESPASTVASGAELRLSGREFAAGEDHRLRLVGALEEHDLGTVSPDTAGTFELAVRIPAEASPGRYQLEAVAPDGDVAALLPVTVVAGSAAAGDGAAGNGASDDEGAVDAGQGPGPSSDGATAEDLEIDRSRSGLEWSLIVALLGGALGAGVGLLRRDA